MNEEWYFNSDDSIIENSIQHKKESKLYQRELSNNVQEYESIYEHFFLIGAKQIDALEKDVIRPKILFMYPSSPLIFDPKEYQTIIDHCFPNGFKEIQTGNKKNIFQQFIFRLNDTKRNSSIYGFCYQTHFHIFPNLFYEDDSPATKYPVCFCLLTYIPMISTHFCFLHFIVISLLKKEKFIHNREITHKYIQPEEKETLLLDDMFYYEGGQKINSINIPSVLFSELKLYKALHISSKSFSVKFSSKTEIFFPSNRKIDMHSYYTTLDCLFSVLSTKNIIKIISTLLLEKTIIIKSKHLHNLTFVNFALISLLSPFKFNGLNFPILPNTEKYISLLDSPIPYLCGLYSLNNVNTSLGSIVVDLDKDYIHENTEIPVIPDSQKLIHRIEHVINHPSILMPQKYNKNIFFQQIPKVNPEFLNFVKNIHYPHCPNTYYYNNPQKYIFNKSAVHDIIKIFRMHLAPKIQKLIEPFFITDSTDAESPITILNHNLLINALGDMEYSEVKFYNQFFTTINFHEFCEEKADEKEKQY